jgi:hypothetical protein
MAISTSFFSNFEKEWDNDYDALMIHYIHVKGLTMIIFTFSDARVNASTMAWET